MYIIIWGVDHWSRFDPWDRVLRAGALGWPWGMGWGGRWEWGSGWGTHVCPWLIHVNVWQKPLQYCKIISPQLNKLIFKKRKIMTNLDSILKSRDITLPKKVRIVKAMVFPVVMYGCESWIIKKAEHWRTDPFELRWVFKKFYYF